MLQKNHPKKGYSIENRFYRLFLMNYLPKIAYRKTYLISSIFNINFVSEFSFVPDHSSVKNSYTLLFAASVTSSTSFFGINTFISLSALRTEFMCSSRVDVWSLFFGFLFFTTTSRTGRFKLFYIFEPYQGVPMSRVKLTIRLFNEFRP